MADLSTITLPSGDTYNLKDNNAIPSSEKAVANGVATLDANGLIPQSQVPGMVILSYGNNTFDDFLEAYQKNNIIYCRASSNSNPASGSQTRLAFMAYVNNATSPTEVEFQYYRSVSSHSATQQGDQVYVYKLNKNSGWSVTVRETYTRVVTNNGLTSTWSGGILTAKADLVSDTKLTNSATAATEVSDRVYPVALDTNGKLAVNVPWESGALSDRMAKGTFVNPDDPDDPDTGNVVAGAIKTGDFEYVKASGLYSFAENGGAAYGDYSHAEGFAIASGYASHAEADSTASGNGSHAEGYSEASGEYAHAEGDSAIASGYASHAEGYSEASGEYAHAEGDNTIANHKSQHVFGEYNIADASAATVDNRGNYVEIVGNGTTGSARSNARTLDWSGNETLAGKLTVGTGPTNNMDVATKQYVDGKSVRISSVEYEALTPAEKVSDTTYFVYDESKDAPQGGDYVQADLSDTEAEYVEESNSKITKVGTVTFSINGDFSSATLPSSSNPTTITLTLNGSDPLPDFDFYTLKMLGTGVYTPTVNYLGYEVNSDLTNVVMRFHQVTGSTINVYGSGLTFDLYKFK